MLLVEGAGLKMKKAARRQAALYESVLDILRCKALTNQVAS